MPSPKKTARRPAKPPKKAVVRRRTKAGQLSSVDGRGAWFPLIREPFPGAWQRNQEWTVDTVLSYHAVYACITLISQDVGKLRPKLVEQDADGIWTETRSSSFSPVLRKPNRYQNHIQFKEWWILSKLIRGNTYALKQRDDRGIVTALYLLDPSRVKVLVAPDGSVFYELSQDNLTGLEQGNITVPASEIIHDRMNCLFHPLVGTSPIFASGMAANVGLKIQENAVGFFGTGSNPSGVLTAPAVIEVATAERLAAEWKARFGGQNSGAVAVLGEGLKFEPMRMSAVDSQLLETLKWSAEVVCSTFHVPPFKVGIGSAPSYPNATQTLNQIYYSDCLQSHIESFEAVMDEGLGLTEGPDGRAKDGRILGVELDLDALLRMDSGAQMDTLVAGLAGVLTPNEARMKLDLKPLKGGDTVYLQQQNYSLAALDRRDQAAPAPSTTPTTPAADAPSAEETPAEDEATKAVEIVAGFRKAMAFA